MQNQRTVDNVFCFCWSAIAIGALIAVGLGFLLDLFGIGVGLSSYTTDVEGATKVAVGGFLGMLIGAIATMFTAGFAAGYFAGPHSGKSNFGVIYGFVSWSLSLLLAGFFATHILNYSDTKSSFVSSPTTTQVQATTEHVATHVHPTTTENQPLSQKNVRAVGVISLSVFFLFIIGALAACFGGYFGVEYWKKRENL